jgi:hypothetical protein
MGHPINLQDGGALAKTSRYMDWVVKGMTEMWLQLHLIICHSSGCFLSLQMQMFLQNVGVVLLDH